MKTRVLCLLADGFEEIETVAPVDVLRRAGLEVVMASINGRTTLTGRSGIQLIADVLLESVSPDGFDVLLIPGGPGVKALRADGRAALLAGEFNRDGKRVAAICAAPTVLADAGLLEGRRFTAHFSVRDEIPQLLSNERVVVDGRIITARGAGTALEFGLALVAELLGQTEADEVARAIMH